MKKFSWWRLCLIYFSALLSITGGQTCGEIGTVNSGSFSAARGHGFYLNTQDTATCDGTIDRFEYCYDRTDQTYQVISYEFTVAVYRNTGGTYQPVSGREFRVTRDTGNSNSGFGCGDPFMIDPPLEVQVGDAIGVCIYDPPDLDSSLNSNVRLQLDVLEQSPNIQDQLMMTSIGGCGLNTVPTSVSSLTMIGGRVLHVWTDISPPATDPPTSRTTIGTTQPDTTSATVPLTRGSTTSGTDPMVQTLMSSTTPSGTETTGISDSIAQSTTSSTDGSALPQATVVGVSAAAIVVIVIFGIILTIAVVIFIVFKHQQKQSTMNNHTLEEVPLQQVTHSTQPLKITHNEAFVEKGRKGDDAYWDTDFSTSHAYEVPIDTDHYYSIPVVQTGKSNGQVVGINEAYGVGLQNSKDVYYFPQPQSRKQLNNETYVDDGIYSYPQTTLPSMPSREKLKDKDIHVDTDVYSCPQTPSMPGKEAQKNEEIHVNFTAPGSVYSCPQTPSMPSREKLKEKDIHVDTGVYSCPQTPSMPSKEAHKDKEIHVKCTGSAVYSCPQTPSMLSKEDEQIPSHIDIGVYSCPQTPSMPSSERRKDEEDVGVYSHPRTTLRKS